MPYGAASSIAAYRPVAQVEPSTLAEHGDVPLIQTFNISSDGTRMALTYRTGKYKEEVWVALLDIPTKKIMGRIKLVDHTTPPPRAFDPAVGFFNEHYLSQLKWQSDVVFSSDERHVIAMSLGRVWILDGNNCSIMRAIDPPQFPMVAAVDMQTVAGSQVAVTYEFAYEQFQVDFYDLATGKWISGWRSMAIPQSFSPDGKLVVAADPDIRNSGGVTNVEVLEARTGAKLKSIPVRFHFSKTWLGFGKSPVARESVVSEFLSNDEIVVTPGGDRDSAGHSSGNGLEIINIPQGRIVREIRPKHYGPTGVIAESADLTHFLVESLYASPASFSSDSLDPKDYRYEIMVFANSGATPKAVVPFPDTPDAPTRISADASTMAFEADGTVQILGLGR